jgi:hypothetical protein
MWGISTRLESVFHDVKWRTEKAMFDLVDATRSSESSESDSRHESDASFSKDVKEKGCQSDTLSVIE